MHDNIYKQNKNRRNFWLNFFLGGGGFKVHTVPMKNLYSELSHMVRQGFAIDSRLFAFAAGIDMSHREETQCLVRRAIHYFGVFATGAFLAFALAKSRK